MADEEYEERLRPQKPMGEPNAPHADDDTPIKRRGDSQEEEEDDDDDEEADAQAETPAEE